MPDFKLRGSVAFFGGALEIFKRQDGVFLNKTDMALINTTDARFPRLECKRSQCVQKYIFHGVLWAALAEVCAINLIYLYGVRL
jgi:hypothetical protein